MYLFIYLYSHSFILFIICYSFFKIFDLMIIFLNFF